MGGVVNFLRRIFAEESPKEETVFIRELPKWFKEKTKPIYESTSTELTKRKDEIFKVKEKVKADLKKLGEAKLKNKNIPERAIQILNGNRDSYIKKIQVFFDYLNPQLDSLDEALQFCEKTNKELDHLNSSTSKSYYVLQEFMANESREVAFSLKSIHKILEDIRKLIMEGDIDWIRDLEAEMSNLDKGLNQKKQMSAVIHALKETSKSLDAEKKGCQQNLDQVVATPEYKSYVSVVETRTQLKKLLEKQGLMLRTQFTAIDHALKKYQRMSMDEQLVKDYLENPLSAVLQDTQHKIVQVLTNLRKNIESDTLALKDTKKIKSLEALKILNNEFFIKFTDDYNKLQKDLKDINEKLTKFTVASAVAKLNAQIDDVKAKIAETEKKIIEKSENVKKFESGHIIEKIRKVIEERMNIILEVRR